MPRRGPPTNAERIDIAARSIGAVTVRTNLYRSQVLAGANFGADGRLGGSGADADSYGAGDIGRVRIGG